MKIKAILDFLFPKSLWTKRFTIMWTASFILIICFDVLWSLQTTFRSMSFIQTYLFAGLLATLISIPTAISPKKFWIQTILMAFLAGIFESNLMYFRTYFSAIPASSYLLIGNLADFKASVYDSIRVGDVCLLLPIVIGSILTYKMEIQDICRKAFSYTFLSLVSLSAISTLPYGGMLSHINYLTEQCYYINTPIVIYTPFGKIASDISQQQEPLSEKDYQDVLSFYESHKAKQHFITDSIKVPDNVIVVFLESFESWVINSQLDGIELTPTLNALLREPNTLFIPHVATQVGTGRSIDAQLLMLSGLYPMQNEVYSMRYHGNTYYTLPQALKHRDNKLKTYLLTGDKSHVWNQSLVARAFDIDTILDSKNWNITEKIGNPPKLSDNALFAQTVDKMKSGEIWAKGTNAYIHIVAYSTHNPFVIPKEYKIHSFNHYYGKLGDYASAVNYTDNALSQLIRYLKTRDDYDKTMVVIAGDHEGVEMYRKEMINAWPGVVDSRQFTPLIILNSPVSGKFDEIIGQVDVYSTLVDLLALKDTKWKGLGYSAFDESHPHAAINALGEYVTNIEMLDSVKTELKRAQKVSNNIIKYDLMNNVIGDK